jgi:hypothetical protein
MSVEIQKAKSKSGNRTMWRVLVDGKNPTATLYARKWEAMNVAKHFQKKLAA